MNFIFKKENYDYEKYDLLALGYISKLLPNYFPITAFSMSPYCLLTLSNIINTKKPKYILEFGSGLSTVFISKMIHERNLNTSLISIDNSKEWQNIVNEWILENDKKTTLYDVDCVNQACYNYSIEWYNKLILKQILSGYNQKFDLIIVDAPVSKSSLNRLGVSFVLEEFLADDGIVFIDDAHRENEIEMMNILCEKFRLTNISLTNRLGLLTRSNSNKFVYEPFLWNSIKNNSTFKKK